MEETYAVTTHLAYLSISVVLTVWVARTLHKHGQIFLVEAFGGNERLADSVNRLLVVGFYLINVGYICLMVKHGGRPQMMSNVLEELGTRVGGVLLVLGGMHFMNLYVFSRIRRRATLHREPPPVRPSGYVQADRLVGQP
jgi:hypothetical protein